MDTKVVDLIVNAAHVAKLAAVDTIIIDRQSIRGMAGNVFIFDQKSNDLGAIDTVGINRIETLMQRVNIVRAAGPYTATETTDTYDDGGTTITFLRNLTVKAKRSKAEYRCASPRLIRMFKRIPVDEIVGITMFHEAKDFMAKGSSAMNAETLQLVEENGEVWAKFLDINGDALQQQVGTVTSGSFGKPVYSFALKQLIPLLRQSSNNVALTDKGLLRLEIQGVTVYYSNKV